jgi:hypothetical protein
MITEENGEVIYPRNKGLLWTAKDLESGIVHLFTDRESAQIYALSSPYAVSIRPPLFQ